MSVVFTIVIRILEFCTVVLTHLGRCFDRCLCSEIGWRAKEKASAKGLRLYIGSAQLVLPTHPTCLSPHEIKSQFQGYPPRNPSSSVPHSESIEDEK